jgi:hypothetical protein
MYAITFGFWVEAMQIKSRFSAPDNLFISREAAVKIDLLQLEAKQNADVPRLALDVPKTRLPVQLDAGGIERSLKTAQMVYSDATSSEKRIVTPTRRSIRRA